MYFPLLCDWDANESNSDFKFSSPFWAKALQKIIKQINIWKLIFLSVCGSRREEDEATWMLKDIEDQWEETERYPLIWLDYCFALKFLYSIFFFFWFGNRVCMIDNKGPGGLWEYIIILVWMHFLLQLLWLFDFDLISFHYLILTL